MPTTWYLIRSSSRSNLFHRVSQTGSRYVCECEDYTYRGPKDCRHIEQVKRGCGVIAQPKRRSVPAVMPVRVLRSREAVDLLYGVAS